MRFIKHYLRKTTFPYLLRRRPRAEVKLLLTTLLLIVATILQAQTTNPPPYEQIAFNYFVDSLLHKNLGTEKIFYNPVIQSTYSRPVYTVCFKDYVEVPNISKALSSHISDRDILVLKNKNKNVRPKKKTTKLDNRTYLLEIRSAVDRHVASAYVEIVARKKWKENYFWIEVDSQGNIKRWCRSAVQE